MNINYKREMYIVRQIELYTYILKKYMCLLPRNLHTFPNKTTIKYLKRKKDADKFKDWNYLTISVKSFTFFILRS